VLVYPDKLNALRWRKKTNLDREIVHGLWIVGGTGAHGVCMNVRRVTEETR